MTSPAECRSKWQEEDFCKIKNKTQTMNVTPFVNIISFVSYLLGFLISSVIKFNWFLKKSKSLFRQGISLEGPIQYILWHFGDCNWFLVSLSIEQRFLSSVWKWKKTVTISAMFLNVRRRQWNKKADSESFRPFVTGRSFIQPEVSSSLLAKA